MSGTRQVYIDKRTYILVPEDLEQDKVDEIIKKIKERKERESKWLSRKWK